MRQEELIDQVATKIHFVKSDVRLVVTHFVEAAVEALLKGDEVCLTGIGKIRPSVKKGRKGRNPKTGEDLIIPDKTVLKLSVAKALKDLINPSV